MLMHSADACTKLEQTEQPVALLVQSYVQPQASGTGEHLAGLISTDLTPSDCCYAESFKEQRLQISIVTRALCVQKAAWLSQILSICLEQACFPESLAHKQGMSSCGLRCTRREPGDVLLLPLLLCRKRIWC